MNGILLIDKPAGMSSRQVDNRLGARFGRALRIGHAGTLDPFATGVLPVMVGEGTKLSRFLTGGAKSYAGELCLGVQTDTADSDGAVEQTAPVPPLDDAAILAAMAALTGEIDQIPPAYSAVKVGGRPLYKLARAGKAVEAPARRVRVDAWRLAGCTGGRLRFEVDCGAGTYVRTLGEQLAARLGTLGHLTALRRLRAGRFRIDGCQSLEEALAEPRLVPVAEAAGLPAVIVSGERAVYVAHGRAVAAAAGDPPGPDALAVDERGEPAALLSREGDVWRVARGFSLAGAPKADFTG